MNLTNFTLRKARNEDIGFLFEVSSQAMMPVYVKLNPNKVYDKKEEFEKYKNEFGVEGIDVIQFEGEDIGRLRVVRDGKSIYIGGVQILPKYQNKGIGKAIFQELINESEIYNIPIKLEVHDTNEKAFRFYKNLGFKEVGKIEFKTLMEYKN